MKEKTKVGNIIVSKPDRFVMVGTSVVENLEIDAEALGVLVRILHFGDKWNLNVRGLSRYLRLSERRTRAIFVLLEESGYVKRVAVRGDGNRFVGWDYMVYAEPLPEEERSHAGKSRPCSFGQVGKPTSRNLDKTENRKDHNIESDSNYKKETQYEKESSRSNTHARNDGDDNALTNNLSQANDSKITGSGLFIASRDGMTEEQVYCLDLLDRFRRLHPCITLYDKNGFYVDASRYVKRDNPDWPIRLGRYVGAIKDHYAEVQREIEAMADEFGEPKPGELFLGLCDQHTMDSVSIAIKELYEKRQDYIGQTTLKKALLGFIKRQSRVC